ncbi:hypothetical protein C4F51_05285 [Cellvibrio sp. KB43]|uniref:Uncharacterized protein n=1 Tax=Cellvibrio polysaccharolyticus TaxID=2082724 RepID=A0A928V5Q5_9GAMM|nr:hypothetical protein [Cellvibrio polysaccharolyticus]
MQRAWLQLLETNQAVIKIQRYRKDCRFVVLHIFLLRHTLLFFEPVIMLDPVTNADDVCTPAQTDKHAG